MFASDLLLISIFRHQYVAQILIEFKTTRSAALSISYIWNATISLANDAPLLNAEPILQFDAIGGTPIVIPLRPNSFQPNPIQPEPFRSALLTFSVFQWSVSLGASVAMIPIQTTVRTILQNCIDCLCMSLYVCDLRAVVLEICSVQDGAFLSITPAASSIGQAFIYNYTARSGSCQDHFSVLQ